MKKIIGLGNPGEKYKTTRHNIGRIILNDWQKQEGLSPFKKNTKINALTTKGGGFVLALPETFMNSSGISVKKMIKKTEDLWVVHDDTDLPFGTIRISKDKGSAGHNGIESIIKEIKTKDFVRFRIGIKPLSRIVFSENLAKFVLKKFTKKEDKTLENITNRTIQILKFALKEGIERAMNKFNQND